MLQKTTFKLEPYGALGTSSEYAGFNFGCAQEPKDGKIKLVHSYHSCREGLMSSMRSRITGKSDVEQPTDKMRIIFRWAAAGNNNKKDLKAIDGWIERSVAVLQAFDRLAGWPLTRAYRIETNYDSWLRAYYFHSSRRWMKSSYLVSLYTLLVRMCKDERIAGFKDFDGLVKIVGKITKAGGLRIDNTYVKDSLPYWKAIMTGYSELFRQRKLAYYWDTGRLSGDSLGGAEGVQYLVKGDTRYTKIREKLLDIKKQLDSKKS
jgi:hypothetical protein